MEEDGEERHLRVVEKVHIMRETRNKWTTKRDIKATQKMLRYRQSNREMKERRLQLEED